MHKNSSLKDKMISNKKVKSIISKQSQLSENLNINNSAQLNVLIQDITQEMDESD